LGYIQNINSEKIELSLSEETEKTFEELIVEVIDQVLLSLDPRVKKSFYNILKTDYNLDKSDIPYRIGDFVNALEEVYGISALLVEVAILKKVCQELPAFTFVVENAQLNLVDFLKSLKIFMEI